MHITALVLVLAAAGVHATWNLLAKRAASHPIAHSTRASTPAPTPPRQTASGAPAPTPPRQTASGAPAGGLGRDAVFVWLCAVTSSLLWAPLAVPLLIDAWTRLDATRWGFLVGSGIIHMGYFLLLQRGYANADLSIVYPVARGSGPLLSSLAAVAIYHERPSATAATGIGLILVGIALLARPAGARRATVGSAVRHGVATGVLIACYTVWDKHAVADLVIPPLLMEWITSLTRVVCLLPLAWMRRVQVIDEWRAKRGLAVAVGALSPLSYLLVLMAMTFAPVSLVAPAREISVVIGVLLGVGVLGEGDAVLRLTSATLTICGVVLLAMG